jgi:hypothetical protein
MKILAATIIALLAIIGTASAVGPLPMVPYGAETIPGGASVPNALLMGVPNAAGGGNFPPPPTCSNQLDFSQACNSQYLLTVVMQ